MNKKYITVNNLSDALNHYLDLAFIHGGLIKALNSDVIIELYDEKDELLMGRLSCCSIDKNGNLTLSADIEKIIKI